LRAGINPAPTKISAARWCFGCPFLALTPLANDLSPLRASAAGVPVHLEILAEPKLLLQDVEQVGVLDDHAAVSSGPPHLAQVKILALIPVEKIRIVP
jgi:hypothetical protein